MGGPGDGPQSEGHRRRDVPPRRGDGCRGHFSYGGSSSRCGERRESRRVAAARTASAAAVDARLSARAAGLSVRTAVVPADAPLAGVVVRFRLLLRAEARSPAAWRACWWQRRCGTTAGNRRLHRQPLATRPRAYSSSGETTVYRRAPAQGGADRGWEAESTDAGGPGAAVELSAAGQDRRPLRLRRRKRPARSHRAARRAASRSRSALPAAGQELALPAAEHRSSRDRQLIRTTSW